MTSNVNVVRTAGPAASPGEQQAMNEAARQLLREWLADDSGYDETTWPLVKHAIEANRLSARPRFDG